MKELKAIIISVLLISLLSAVPLQAAWINNGVRVTEGERVEFEPRIASDGAGGAYIAWEQGFVSAFLKNSIFILD